MWCATTTASTTKNKAKSKNKNQNKKQKKNNENNSRKISRSPKTRQKQKHPPRHHIDDDNRIRQTPTSRIQILLLISVKFRDPAEKAGGPWSDMEAQNTRWQTLSFDAWKRWGSNGCLYKYFQLLEFVLLWPLLILQPLKTTCWIVSCPCIHVLAWEGKKNKKNKIKKMHNKKQQTSTRTVHYIVFFAMRCLRLWNPRHGKPRRNDSTHRPQVEPAEKEHDILAGCYALLR